MHDIEHPRLGRLVYDGEEGWDGWIELPLFAECRSIRLERDILRLTERDGESPAVDPPEDEFDAADREENRQRAAGKLQIRINEVAGDKLSAAQERSIDFLLDHEAEVLQVIVNSLSRDFRQYDETERAFLEQSGLAESAGIPSGFKSPDDLKEMMSFSYVEIGADSLGGYVQVSLSGACDWDEEHGFNVELLKDRVLDWEHKGPTGFPAKIPTSISLDAFLPIGTPTSSVEFLIYGRWSGIYHIDRDGTVVGRTQCPLCPGENWDPEGVEAVRPPEPKHLKLSTSPTAFLLPGAAIASGCFAPALLILGLIIWGGLYWGALALSLFEVTAKWLHPLLRNKVYQGDYLRPAGVAAVAIAGIVYWHTHGTPGPRESVLGIIGWIVWGISALAFLSSVKNAVISVMQRSRQDNPLPLSLAAWNFLFAAVMGVALWKTWTEEVSKLHLLWILPLVLVVCLLLGIRQLLQRFRNLGARMQPPGGETSQAETIVMDPEEFQHRPTEQDAGESDRED